MQIGRSVFAEFKTQTETCTQSEKNSVLISRWCAGGDKSGIKAKIIDV